MQKGFTLIELAIVVVIIALITGGVLAGRSIVEQAHLNNSVKKIAAYTAAFNTFQLKFNAIPGDFSSASNFGLDRDSSGTQNVTYTNYTDYNGNGDGFLVTHGLASVAGLSGGEVNNFWIHLSNSGIIKESYSQTYGCNFFTATKCDTTAGVAYPKTSIGGGMAFIRRFNPRESYIIHGIGNSLPYSTSFNALTEGKANSVTSETLTPYQAYAIDFKLDDSKPDVGKIKVYSDWVYTGADPVADSSLSSTDCYSVAGGDYNLDVTNKVCSIAIKID